jgi:pimeloyl-ACP methyl ester carboxylesterase
MSNEALILVPGLLCTRALFAPQVDALAPSVRIIVADHARDDAMKAIASRLLAAAPTRFALAGLSMGGYVALEVLRQAPERVTRLALLDTSARPDTEDARERRLGQIAVAEAGRFEEVQAELWPRLIHPDRLHDRALEAIVRGMMRESGVETFVRQQRAIMGRRDSRALLGAIEVPTLVLVGAQDALTPPELAREMADGIEGASLVVVPQSGHLSTLERPEAVTRALQAWLSLDADGRAAPEARR